MKKPILGTHTHPETGVRLWRDLTVSLPVERRWIVLGTPALVHPQTGILFGVALVPAFGAADGKLSWQDA